MILEIFDVEHGACALITTSNGKRVMIDCGHNGTTGWRPGTALLASGIRNLHRLFVTNFDEDHVSGYPNLADSVHIAALFCNQSVPPATIRYLKSEDGMGVGIEHLIRDIERIFTGGAPGAEDFGDTSFSVFWNPCGTLLGGGFVDENNLSLSYSSSAGSTSSSSPATWRELAGFNSCITGRLSRSCAASMCLWRPTTVAKTATARRL